MFRALVVASFGFALLISPSVFALKVGKTAVHSFLGQPLDARVPVFSEDANEINALQVNSNISGLSFRVERINDKRAYVHIASKAIIQDSFKHIPLALTWPGGQMVHDVSLMLQTPQTNTKSAETITPPGARTIGPGELSSFDASLVETRSLDVLPPPTLDSAPVSLPQGSASVESVNRSILSAAINDTQPVISNTPFENRSPVRANRFVVLEGQTLYQIASNIAPANTISMMVSLYENNLKAFVNKDYNLLKAGAQLTIPVQLEYSERQAKRRLGLMVKASAAAKKQNQSIKVKAMERKPTKPVVSTALPTPTNQASQEKKSDKTTVKPIEKVQAEKVQTAEPVRPVELPSEINTLSPAGVEMTLSGRLNNQAELDSFVNQESGKVRVYLDLINELPVTPGITDSASVETSDATHAASISQKEESKAFTHSYWGVVLLIALLLIGIAARYFKDTFIQLMSKTKVMPETSIGVLASDNAANAELKESKAIESSDNDVKPQVAESQIETIETPEKSWEETERKYVDLVAAVEHDKQEIIKKDSVYVIDESEYEVETLERINQSSTSMETELEREKRVFVESVMPVDGITPRDFEDGAAEAMDEYERIQVEGSTQDVMQDYLTDAELIMRFGHYNRAILLLRQALEMNPTHLAIRVKLLEAYVAMMDTESFARELAVYDSLKGKNEVYEAQIIALKEQIVSQGDNNIIELNAS